MLFDANRISQTLLFVFSLKEISCFVESIWIFFDGIKVAPTMTSGLDLPSILPNLLCKQADMFSCRFLCIVAVSHEIMAWWYFQSTLGTNVENVKSTILSSSPNYYQRSWIGLLFTFHLNGEPFSKTSPNDKCYKFMANYATQIAVLSYFFKWAITGLFFFIFRLFFTVDSKQCSL